MLLVRIIIHWFFVKLFFVLFLVATKSLESHELQECSAEIEADIIWPNTSENTCISSKPICLKENLEISKRCCLKNQIWDITPTCGSVQETIENPCPESSAQRSNICTFVIMSSYPTKCPYEENLAFDQYYSYIYPDEFPIWLPITRRNSVYGIGLFYWNEISEKYKTVFDSFEYKGSLLNKACLIYNTEHIEAVECSEIHRTICAYSILNKREKTFCSQTFDSTCKQSNYSTKSVCFCKIQNDEQNLNKIELVYPYQNLLYESLNEVCYIGLKKQYGEYIWTNSNVSVKYTNWAPSTMFSEEYVYGAISPDGWVLKTNDTEENCALIETYPSQIKGEIKLTYDEVQTMFTVVVTNPSGWKQNADNTDPLLFCFTDAAKLSIVEKLNLNRDPVGNTVQFSFAALDDGPGHYWCEGFSYPELKSTRSTIYLLEPQHPEFVVTVVHKYSSQTNPLSQDYLVYTHKLITDDISLHNSKFYPRIFKIENIDEESHKATLKFHLTTNAIAYKDIYESFTMLGAIDFDGFISSELLIASECIGSQITKDDGSKETWTSTRIGNTAVKPMEYWCIGTDGSVITRYCGGNFIDGASWSPLTSNCTKMKTVSPTLILQHLKQMENPALYLDLITQLTYRINEITSYDVDLISDILNLIKNDETDLDVITLAQTIDGIINIPIEVLKDAHYSFNSTNKILESIDRILEKTAFVGDVTTNSVSIISFSIENFYSNSIIWEKGDVYTALFLNLTDDNFSSIKNFDSGVIFNKKLMENIISTVNKSTKIIIIAYFKSSLFNEDISRGYVSTVITTIFPTINIAEYPDLDNLLLTIYNNEHESDLRNCSYWNNLNWYHKTKSQTTDQHHMCKFKRLTNVGLVSTTDITKVLDDLLSSSEICSVILDKLLMILSQYLSLLKTEDVNLIQRILDKCYKEKSFSTQMHIVDKVLSLPMSILRDIVITDRANLRKTFERILLNYDQTIMLPLTNFIVAIQYLKDGNITGFYIDCIQYKCTVNLTYDYSAIPDESELTLTIDERLLEQLLSINTTKIIITLFANDFFFVTEEDRTSRSFSKAIGVLIPGFDKEFEGNIAITYTIGAETRNETCEYWDEFWERSNPVVPVINGQYKCEFWKGGYYALAYTSLKNVTELLEELLNLQANDPLKILNEIRKITNDYLLKLQAIDINLIANLFSMLNKIVFDGNTTELMTVHPVETIQQLLEQSVGIIDHLIQVDRYILQDAEKDYSAIHQILKELDELTKQLKSPFVVCGSYILIVAWSPQEERHLGIEYNINDICNYVIVNDTFSNSSSGIKFSNELLKELEDAASDVKVVLTIFSKDVFFYENIQPVETSTILGVSISNIDEYLNSNISIFYKKEDINPSITNCVIWHPINNNNIAMGTWYLPRKITGEYTCNYYKQGWYTIQTDVIPINITAALMNVTGDSCEQILESLDSITTYYERFSAYDTYLFSEILSDSMVLNDRCLIIFNRIVINFFKIPTDIRQLSQICCYALENILSFISNMKYSLKFNTTFSIEGNINMITCYLQTSNRISVIKDEIICQKNNVDIYDITIDYFNGLNGEATILGVTVFDNNEFFVESKQYETSKIVGISTNIPDTSPDHTNLSFSNSQMNFANYSCACWQPPSEGHNGTWIYLRTIKSESETSCIVPSLESCGYVTLVKLTISDMLKSIYELTKDNCECTRTRNFNVLALTFDVIVSNFVDLQPEHIDMVYSILTSNKLENEEDLQTLSAIINQLMKVDRGVLAQAQELGTFTSLHSSITKIFQQYKGEISITNNKNFALIIQSNITGIQFQRNNSFPYSIEKVLAEYDEANDSDITLLISKPMRRNFRADLKYYITVFFTDALFIGKFNLDIRNRGIIVGISVADSVIEPSIRTSFKNFEKCTCAYWTNISLNDNTETGYWKSINSDPCENYQSHNYFAILEEYNVTSDLEHIYHSNRSIEEQLQEVIHIVNQNKEYLQHFDIHLIASIINKVLYESSITMDYVNYTSIIISSLYAVNQKVLKEAQYEHRSTDSILYVIDEIAKKVDYTLNSSLVYQNFTLTKIDVKTNYVTGLILGDCFISSCQVKFLINKTLDDLDDIGYFQTAFIFSEKLLEEIWNDEDPVNLIVSVYLHNNFFNELSSRIINANKILGLVLEGSAGNSIQGKIYLIYNITNKPEYNNSRCAFWKYEVGSYPGYWKEDARLNKTYKDKILCEYDHLTHFVLLLASSGSTAEYLNQSYILDIITNINSILSLLGLFGILLTAVLFDRWRNNTGNQILINFAIAVSIKNVMLYISEGVHTENKRSMGCTITGGILHYSVLSEFCWMLIIAVLQFKRFVEVLGGPLKYVLLKACICGWVFPALPVFLIIIIDVDNYNISDVGLCYPSGFGLYLGVWLPLVVIISINFVIFVFILYNVFHKKTEYREQVNHEILFQWRLAILLFSMLGLTWCFGFLALIFHVPAFAVVFCLLATLQGFIMFLFFIVFNKNTRYLYIQAFSWWMYSKGYKDRLN